ncbi:MAG: FAD-dependent monooxygenase [Saprospiraceae bacterium]|nr:FAD-dependent monooxygenase [Saprospiraceae bacterium]
MTIDIIGAGIGGLTTAIALEKKGYNTRIFEQAKAIKPVGAGIILANNAMQVFEKLGLRAEIEEHGNPISSMNITKADLKPLSKVDLSFFEQKYQVKNIAIHRGILQKILINALKNSSLHLHHHLDKLETNQETSLLSFKNGKQIQSPMLIGADGIHSVVRQYLFPKQEIRNAKQICWRGISQFNLPPKYSNELNEAWGKENRFGFVQIAKDKVYWYALKSFKESSEEFQVEDLENYFAQYNPLVQQLILNTVKTQIHIAEMTDLKPNYSWYKDNVCLIGDAAHAMTPNMGQGACQSIVDAYFLANCMYKYKPLEAFSIFQKIRLPNVHKVVKTSWMIGKIAHLSNPILRAIRNQLMKWTPSAVNRKQSEQIFQLPNLL